jgi:hypothetical protein
LAATYKSGFSSVWCSLSIPRGLVLRIFGGGYGEYGGVFPASGWRLLRRYTAVGLYFVADLGREMMVLVFDRFGVSEPLLGMLSLN